jgi:hypothetical protein
MLRVLTTTHLSAPGLLIYMFLSGYLWYIHSIMLPLFLTVTCVRQVFWLSQQFWPLNRTPSLHLTKNENVIYTLHNSISYSFLFGLYNHAHRHKRQNTVTHTRDGFKKISITYPQCGVTVQMLVHVTEQETWWNWQKAK